MRLMNMAFFPGAGLRRKRRATALDYPMLVALLNAAQDSGAAAYGEDSAAAAIREDGSVIDLIEGGPAWRRAILGQGGSFNREIAEREGDAPSG